MCSVLPHRSDGASHGQCCSEVVVPFDVEGLQGNYDELHNGIHGYSKIPLDSAYVRVNFEGARTLETTRESGPFRTGRAMHLTLVAK